MDKQYLLLISSWPLFACLICTFPDMFRGLLFSSLRHTTIYVPKVERLAEDAEEMATARAVAGQAPTLDGLCSVLIGVGRSGNQTAPAARTWEEKFLSLTDAQVNDCKTHKACQNVLVVVAYACVLRSYRKLQILYMSFVSHPRLLKNSRLSTFHEGVVRCVFFRGGWGHLGGSGGRWPLYMCG